MKSLLHKLLLLVFISFFSTTLIQSQNVLNFDGLDDYVDCSTILTTSYTKEALIKIPTAGLLKYNNIISGANGKHVLWVYNNNKLAGGHNSAFLNVQDPNPLSANIWYHVAVTYEAPVGMATHGTMKLYKNGILVATSTSEEPLTNTEQVYIGAYAAANTFTGDMSNVRIWSVVRTAEEIAANINTTFTTVQTNLIRNYTCNQGTGTPHMGTSDLANIPSLSGNGAFMGNPTFILGNVVLPVELLSFQAIPLVGSPSNLLRWQTANELNNKGFQVERLKASGNAWEILGFVAAQSPKGAFRSYEFTDNTPLSMNYYRLREIDNDGKEVLSKVVSLALKGAKGFKVYPTIVSNGSLNVEIMEVQDAKEAAVYSIYNLLGQQVLKSQVTQQIDISALPTGTYLIKVGTEQAKFVKQ